MAYCTQADILEQIDDRTLVELTDDSDLAELDEGVVTRAIEDADSLINGYGRLRYTVPLVPVPSMARKLSVDIAIYNLYARRRGAPEDRRQRYLDAIAFLKEVAAGRASLGDMDGSPAESHRPTITSADRVFTRSGMDGW